MKKAVLIVVAVLTLLAIPVTVFLVAQRQEVRKRAAPATTLALTPTSVTKQVGDTFSLEVKIDTGENQVVATEINLTFDPEKLSAESITNGALFPNILTSGTVESGSASISVGAPSSSQPVNGTGTVAVVRFKALAITDTPVSVRFAQTTFVGSLGEGSNNVLVGTNPARVTITQPSLTPSPTPTLGFDTESSGSSQASSSAVTITTPTKNTSVSDDQPTIKGKAPPGSTVTLIIRSDPITVTVTADANGNWSYTPTTPLASGTHTVIASASNSTTGQTETASTAFVVAAGGSGSSTQSATPVAGNSETTLFLIIVGTMLFFSGALLPIVRRNL